MNIIKGKKEQWHQIIEFSNKQFSTPTKQIDFRIVQPKIYRYENNAKNHLIAYDNEISGLLCNYPNILNIKNEQLKISGIGTVCSDQSRRNQGIMSKLMQEVYNVQQKNGVDISYLVGQRNRYEFFKYYRVIHDYRASINKNNCKYYKIDYGFTQLNVRKINSTDIDVLFDIYSKKEFRVIRDKEKFLDILKTNDNEVYVFEDNQVIGYLTYNGNSKIINEIELADINSINNILINFYDFINTDFLEIIISNFEFLKLKEIAKLVEKMHVITHGNIRVYNYIKVIQALLSYKSNYTKLQDGVFIIEIMNYINICIEVKDNNVKVREINDMNSINLSLTQSQMHELMFRYPTLVEDANEYPELQSWFPLPMLHSLYKNDGI